VSVDVRLLGRGEIGHASRLLGRAFSEDPFIGHVLRDSTRRRLAFPPFFRSVLLELSEFGAIYAAEREGTLIGVAAWAPPNAGSPGTPARFRALLARSIVRALFPSATSSLLGGFASLAEHHPNEPHWYLAFVGIEPRAHGQGIGSALLAPVLAQAERDRVICYLETPFPATHAFYRRFGFEVTAELRPIAGAPPVWSMTRMP
jgi:ribosomal protein S18 acetylase RimI-like enzyme